MDLQSTGGLTVGLRPLRIGNPQGLTRGLQIPEDKRTKGPHSKLDVCIQKLHVFAQKVDNGVSKLDK